MDDERFKAWICGAVGFTLAVIFALLWSGFFDDRTPPNVLIVAMTVALASAGGQLGLFVRDLMAERQRR
jgi:hypothetical protein